MLASWILLAAPLLLSNSALAAPRWQRRNAGAAALPEETITLCDSTTATAQAPLGQETPGILPEGYNPLLSSTPPSAGGPFQTPLPPSNRTSNGTSTGGFQNGVYFTNW